MSYDLNFWNYESGVYLDNQNVYETLSNGEVVDGLEDLPVSEILQSIEKKFSSPKWEKIDHSNNEAGGGAFQISITNQSLRIDCYGMSGYDMNLFMDVGNEFSCPLYDPQMGQRFDGT